MNGQNQSSTARTTVGVPVLFVGVALVFMVLLIMAGVLAYFKGSHEGRGHPTTMDRLDGNSVYKVEFQSPLKSSEFEGMGYPTLLRRVPKGEAVFVLYGGRLTNAGDALFFVENEVLKPLR